MNLITKFTAPTKYDLHPIHTIWEQKLDDGETIRFVQLSSHKEEASWMKLSDMFVILIDDYFDKTINKKQLLEKISDILI